MPEYKLYQNSESDPTGNETQTRSNAIRKNSLTFYPEGVQAKQDFNERTPFFLPADHNSLHTLMN